LDTSKIMLKIVSSNFKDLLEPNMEIRAFPDGERHVRILNFEKYKDQKVTIYHRLYPDLHTSLVELLFILESLKNINSEITVFTPYLPYSRQDKVMVEGEIKSAEAVCKLLADAGCKKLITLDCHFSTAEGEFNYGGLIIKNISLHQELVNYAKKLFNGEEFEVVGPDEGAKYMTQLHGGKHMRKSRQGYDQQGVAYRNIDTMETDHEFSNKNVLILDDIISTGATMLKALKIIKDQKAKKVICAATHGLFAGDALEKLQKVCNSIFVTDSIPNEVSKVSIKNRLND